MDTSNLEQLDENRWQIPATGSMRVPAIIFADRDLIEDMDDKVREQICNVCRLPGIVKSALVMPDAHWGYGFPIGGVAAFDADEGGVISAGGVGFDISCGVRLIHTGMSREGIQSVQSELAHELSRSTPAGVGSTGRIRLDDAEMNQMLLGGAQWAVAEGYGVADDLAHIEEGGCQADADPAAVRQSLPRSTIRKRNIRHIDRCDVWAVQRGCSNQHPLWISRPRTSDRYRVSARDGDFSRGIWHRTSRP